MQIPGYTIIRELGRGGMATVYLAKQDRLGRQVALKVMKPLATSGDDFTSRFIKEGQIIAQLQHPQIVTIYDFNIADGLHYFSMEYLPNGTLADQIARGLSTEQAVEITRRIAQALSIAHDHGVIHRDIKPQNILFRLDGTPVLTDFGIARSVGTGEATQLTNFGMVIGSPRYMSPEQSMSRPIDARSDLYSLGVVFYEMLTQELPYQADDVISLAMKHCTAPLPVLPDALKVYQPIVERLLAKQPEERFGSTQELIRALDAVVVRSGQASSRDDEATRIVPRKKPTEPSSGASPVTGRGSRHLAIIALVVAIVLAIGLSILFIRPENGALDDLIAGLPPPSPGRSATTERYETLALEHLLSGELTQSLELVELALASNPEDGRLNAVKNMVVKQIESQRLLREARRQLALGAFDESLALVEQGLERVPGHPDLVSLRTEVQEERQKQTQENAQRLLAQAQAALEQGSLAESKRLIQDGLALVPEDARFRKLEAEVQSRLEQQQALREVTAQASKLMAEGLLQDSLAMIERGLASAPDDPQLRDLKETVSRQLAREMEQRIAQLIEAAGMSADKGAFAEAIAAIDQALALRPKDLELQDLRSEVVARSTEARAEALFDEARAAFSKQDLGEAMRLTEEGLQVQPSHVGLFAFQSMLEAQLEQKRQLAEAVSTARSLLRDQKVSEGLEAIERGLQLAPDDPELLGLRGEALSAQQRRKEDQVQELVRHATELFETGNLQASMTLADKALELAPHHVELAELRQRILASQAFNAKIESRLQECAQAVPAQGASTATIAAASATASACYRHVLELDPENASARAKLGEISQRLSQSFGQALEAAAEASAQEALAALEALEPDHPRLAEMRASLAALAQLLPEMVSIEGGCFQMGSPDSESGRESDEQTRRACVDPFELAKYETRVADFRRFAEAEGFQTDAERGVGGVPGCWAFDRESGAETWGYQAWADWRTPNRYQDTAPSEPVTCVSWNDAQAYIRWLNEKTGRGFRLPTEAEWEYAARAGTQTTRFWGDAADRTACDYANAADSGQDWSDGFPCNDNFEWVAPSGRFSPNAWGLYDILGNAMEWTCSEYDVGYRGAEMVCARPDSTAPIALRGGAWNSGPAALRSAYRNRNYPESRYNFVGFRLARDLSPE